MKTKTIGEILSEERQQHHLSIEKLAKKTRIKKSDAKTSHSARGKSMKNWLGNFIT